MGAFFIYPLWNILTIELQKHNIKLQPEVLVLGSIKPKYCQDLASLIKTDHFLTVVPGRLQKIKQN